MIEREERDGVIIVRLAHGKVNALDLDFATAIATTFRTLADSDHRAVVLTGTGSAFSAGVDLRRLASADDRYVGEFLAALDGAFEAVFCHPAAVVAAINGHAIAGGCVFAAACDHRVVAAGKARIGIPELAVGVPFPTAALEVMRYAVGTPRLAPLLAEAATYLPDEAVARGLADAVVDGDQLLPHAIARAEELSGSRVPAATFRLTKLQLRRPTIEAIARYRSLDDQTLAERWRDPATREWMSAYLTRVAGASDPAP